MHPHPVQQITNTIRFIIKRFLILASLSLLSFTAVFSQAPTWVPGTPSVPSTGPLSITLNYGINIVGTVYISVYNYSISWNLTGPNIKNDALNGPSGSRVATAIIPVTAGNINTVLQTILNVVNVNTTHTVFVVAEDALGNIQTWATKIYATTLPCPKVDILTGFTQPIQCVNKGATAVFQAVIADPPNSGILKGTTWWIDWGDGTTLTYISTADYDVPPLALRTHTYSTVTSCNYVFTNTIKNPCGEVRSVQYIAVVHGRDIPSDGDGILQLVNNATGSTTIQVCEGIQSIITIRDNSTWNCQNPVLPGGFTAVPNTDPRNIEWLYGQDPTGGTTNTITGTVAIATLGNAPETSTRISPLPYGPASLSQAITIPATCQAGQYFRVYMKEWNKCNWTDPEYVNTFIDINVVAAPPAPTAPSRTICFGDDRTLTVTSPAVGTLTWYSDVTLTTSVGTGSTYVPTQTAAGSYNFWVVDRANTGLTCQGPPTMVTLTINPIPNKPTVSITGSTSFCFDGGTTKVTLTANPNTPPAVSGYQWYKNGTAVGGATTNSITLSQPSENGNYTVRTFGINPTDCPSPLSDPVTITIYSLTNLTQPTNKTVCELGSTTFTASTTDPIQKWQWELSTDGGATWGNANNGIYYNGFNTNSLTVLNTPLSFNGYLYRVQVTTTAGGCIYYSNSALLTVNAIPAPTIAGPASVCTGAIGNVYTTQAGMTNYAWSVSAGGTITAGGGAANNTVTVTWNTAGARTVTVNYTNAAGCSAVNPTVYNVTVNARPTPVIAGPASACINSTGNVYSTAAGMTNYVWTVSAGGTITAGGGTGNNTVTVTWNATGAQTVSVNYNNAAGCPATSPTVYNVTVNPLPTPAIAGPTSVCVSSTGNVYTTQAGMTNYLWTVSAGGTITAGGTTTNNTVTVTWTTTGAKTVTVNYTNGNGCTAASPTSLAVTVNARPAPTIAGPNSVCAGSTGNVYTTQAGMSNYSWTVSAGGTITAGGGNNTITVTWNTAGAQTVTVNYNNAAGCPALSPITYNVTVNPLPVPTITGPAAVCINSTGNVYTTEAGMTNYVWAVSAGGTITAGGGAANNTVTVTWTTAGARTVSVKYTNGNGCTAATPTVYNVAVGTSPATATLTGTGNACSGATSSIASVITGGAPTYTIKYTRNGVAQPDITNYTSGNNYSLGVLPVGSYTYVITSVQDFCGNFVPAGGLPGPYTITINPIPSAAATVNNTPVICNNGNTDIVLHADVASSDFIWTVAYAPATTWTAGKAPVAGTRVNGENTSIAQNLEHNGTQPITVTYSITPRGPGATACFGTTITRTVVVNPAGQVNQPANQVVCNGNSTAVVTFGTANTGGVTTYSWTNDAPTIGLAVSGNGNIAAFAATNGGTAPVVATIVVTPTFTNGTVSCVGPTKSFTITVNPAAQVNQPANQVVCNTGNTTAVTFGTTNSGGATTYAWTNNNTSIGLAANGSGNIASFAATNAGTAPVTATITVTPTFTNALVSCTGPSKNFTIIVNPTGQVNQPANQVVCNGNNTTAITFATTNTGGATTYAWTNDSPTIGLAANGSGNIAAFSATNSGTAPVVATITVTPTYTNAGVSCTGSSKSFTITVNPTAQVNQPGDQVVCNGSNTTAITFGTTNTGGATTYAWTNNTPSIGLAANGTGGTIAAFAATNAGTAPVTATITVTPTFTNAAVSCTGPAKSFTITVNPTAQVNQPANQILCNGSNTAAVNFGTTNSGGITTYTWTNNTPSIGLAASGSGNIAAFAATNAGTAPVVATIVVTPSFTNGSVSCTGPMKSFTITVNPTPSLSSTLTPAAVCSNTVFSYTPISNTTGTTFNWIRAAVAGITPAGPISGSNNPNEILVNITSAPIAVTYAYTLQANGCSNTQNVVVSIKPEPVVSTQSLSVCSGIALNYQILLDNFTNPADGVTFTWPAPTLSAGISGGSARGSASSSNITDTFTNTSGGIGTATYHITPYYNGCTGAVKDFVVTVGSQPVLDPGLNNIVCSNTATGLVLKEAAGSVVPTYYNVISITSDIGLTAAPGNAVVPNATAPAGYLSGDIFTNLTGVNKNVTYRVQPILAPNCIGDPVDVVITVRPQPVIVPGQTKSVCSRAPIGKEILLIPANTPAGTVFNWGVPVMSDASGQGTAGVNVAADPAGKIHINDAIHNYSSAPITATYTVTPTSQFGCVGTAIPVIITINQEPVPEPISGRANLCAGDKNIVYNVTPVGGSSFHWTVDPAVGTKTFDFNTNAILIDAASAAGTGNIKVYETNSLGCSGDPSTLPVTVYTQPAPENIAGNAIVCALSTHVYNVTNRIGSVYNWTIPGGAATIGDPSASSITVLFGTTGGTVLARETNIAGCVTNHNPLSVTVNPLPVATISNGGTICDGGTRPLNVAFMGTAPFNFTYAINGISQTPVSTSSNPYTINATLQGTYTIVNVTDNTGCTNSGSGTATVTYFPRPTGIISGTAEMCRGNSTTLTMTFTGVAPFTFTYTDGTTPVTVTANPSNVYTINVSPTVNTTYTLTSLTDNNSCVGVISGSAIVTVNQPPALSLTGTNLICYNINMGAVDLAISGGTAPFGISWTGPDGFTAPTEDISGLKAGYYAVTVTDSKGCTAAGNITLTQPPVLNAALASTNITCFGASDGTITISGATGGAGTYEYTVNGGTTWTGSGSFTGLAPGTYNVQIRDAVNKTCTLTLNGSLVLTGPAVLNATVTKTDINCFGANNGSIIISSPTGGYGTYQYTINGGTTWLGSGSFTNLTPGTYNVRIRDAVNTGCVVILNPALTVTEPPVLSATVNRTNITCFGSTDGTITITAPAGGHSTYEYSINGGGAWQSSGSFTGLTPGTYNVQIRDAGYTTCYIILNSSLVLTQPAVLSATLASTNVTCHAANDGTITVSAPSGGYGTYEYTVNGGTSWVSSGSFSSLAPGTYDVRIRDAAHTACFVILNGGLQITEPDALTATVVDTDISCFGANDGVITITNSAGGYGTYQFSINGGTTWQNSPAFSPLTPGSYDVRMRDRAHTGCVVILNPAVQITEPAVLNATVTSTNVTCNGANDGIISITSPTGGYGSYSYSINGGTSWQGSGIFANLAPGTYNVMMRDAVHTGCTVILNPALAITEPVILSASVARTNVTCNGAGDGTITISGAAGGYGTYEYTINGGGTWQLSGSFASLIPGFYNIKMRDAAHPLCVITLNASLSITEPAVLAASVAQTNITCNGANDGSITITSPTGGYGTFEYSINGGTTWQASGNFTGLAPATYNVLIRDAAHITCTITLNGALVITQPAVLSATVTPTMISCFGANNGIIAISNPAGGYGTYEYTINGGTTWVGLGNFTGLAPATYDVRIRDAAHTGCSLILNGALIITQPAVLNADIASTNVTCFGGSDGTITLTNPTGGYGTYEYTVNGGGAWQASGSFTGLAPGTYNIQIRDAAHTGCVIVLNNALVITQPAILKANIASTNVTCNGSSDGTITISGASGGYGTYQYSVNGGTSWQATGSFAGLAPSTYDVRIRDAAHIACEIILNPGLTITEPAVLNAVVASTNVTCFGTNDGTITISSPTGGYGTYEYSTNGGATWQVNGTFLSLAPATYNVRIRDKAHTGCVITLNPALVITQPPVLSATVGSTNVTCNGSSDGTITITAAAGGYGTYQYTINGGASWQTSGTFTGIAPGNYDVRIRDAGHIACEIVLNPALAITQPAKLAASVASTNVTCYGANDGTITITSPTGGYGTYEYSVDGGTTWQSGGSFTALAPGFYNVQIRDAAHIGCVVTLNGSLRITEPFVLTANVASTNVTCNGANDGRITITSSSGGYGTYEYSINGGTSWQASGTFTALAPASYNVQIRDAAHTGCVIVLNPVLVITQPAILAATVTSLNVTCFSANDGSISITGAAGGYGIYEYTINGGTTWSGLNNFTNLAPGTYNVRIRDAAHIGCVIILNPALIITQPAVLNANVARTNVTCFGGSDGTITITNPTGGYGTYEYSVNGGGSWQASGTFSSLVPGNYNVQIRDAAHITCVIILNNALQITQPAILNAVVTPTDITCNGAGDGIINVTSPTGGYGTYQYSINGGTTWQNTGLFSSLLPAIYNVQIRDAANPACVIVLNSALEIREPAILNASIASINVTCFGANNGIISITSPTGGYGTYEYSVTGGATWQSSGTFSSLIPGTYDVRIRDKAHAGCVIVLNPALVITQPAVLNATTTGTNVTCNGAGDGIITITNPLGGYGTYSYSINGGASWQSSGTFNFLIPGTYNVKIRDAAKISCEIVLNPALVITQPAKLAATVASTNVTCNGANDGAITITAPTGGYGTYEYSINGGITWQAGGNFNSVAPGFYNVQIRDAAHTGCVVVLNGSLRIPEPPVLAANVTRTNVTCNGAGNGTITITSPSGGYGTYEYSINGGTLWQASGNFTALIPGSYNVQIRDAAHTACVIVLNPALAITEPAVLNATVSSANVTCFGANDGTISISGASGGYGSYQYTVNGGTTWQGFGNFSNLAPGTYDVRIRDAANPTCVVTLNAALLITQPTILAANISGTNVSCFGGNDATITISGASGGYGTYEYSINGGGSWQASGSFAGLTTGSYNILIRDAAHTGCIIVLNNSYIITQPAILAATVTKTDVSCNGSNNGSITITSPSGGYGTYEYSSNGGTSWQASGSFINLAPGTFDIRIRDAAHPACSAILYPNLVITEPLPLTMSSTGDIVLDCNGDHDGIGTFYASGGTMPYSFLVVSNTTGATVAPSGFNSQTFFNAGAGSLTVRVVDLNGCSAQATVNITQPAVLNPGTIAASQVICAGDNPAQLTESSAPTGGPGAYLYQWQSSTNVAGPFINIAGATANVYTPPTGATYTIYYRRMVTSGVCVPVYSNVVEILVNPLPVALLTGGETVCPGQSSILKINLLSGTGPFSIDIANLGTVNGYTSGTDIVVTPAVTTTYSLLRVRDANNCQVLSPSPNLNGSATVVVSTLPSITSFTPSPAVCEFTLAKFNVTATGTNLTYQWYVNEGSGFNSVTDGGTYFGALTPQLQIFNSVRSMNGFIYHVVVSGCSTSVTSADAVFTVNTAPEITQHPKDSTICLGQNAIMQADATGTSVTWQWYVNKGSGFVLSVDDANFSGSTTRTLTITNGLASFNNWIFRAKATGVCGAPVFTNFAALRVINPPSVTVQPAPGITCANGSVSFLGNGTGYNSLQWQVFAGGVWTNLADDATYIGSGTQQLSIINAPVSLNGNQYRLALISACTTTYTNAVALTVNANPVVDFSAVSPIAACGGVPVVINGNPSGGSGIYAQHRWTGDVGPLNSYTVQSPTFNSLIQGSYNLNYKVTDSKGCSGNGNVTVTVDSPSAQFNNDADYGCTPLPVTFTKDMTGIAKWWWNFGDGSPLDSVNSNPVHTFVNSITGSIEYYIVSLKVQSPAGCFADYSVTITVYPAIDATFTASPAVVCSGNSITFTAISGASRYYWDYGDGASGYASYVTSHLYTNLTAAPVIHTVKLTTTSFYNCIDVKTFDITVMPVPLPQFIADPVTQVFNAAGNLVTFTNETNPGTWNWVWRFGDNTVSTGMNPVHSYSDVGTYPVTLIASNANCTDSVMHEVYVIPPAPVARFDSIPSGCAPLYVNINNTSLNTDVPGTTYKWDFGDGSTSTAKNPTYTYFTAGSYRIELIVTGPGGTSNVSQVVNAYASPKAYFELTPAQVYVNDEKVRFFNLSQGANSYLWDFGDGDTTNVKEPFHRYMEEGVYDITLWAYSANGCTDKYVLSPGVTVIPVGDLRFSTVFTPNKTGPIERTDLPTGGTEVDQFFFPPIRQKVIKYKLQIFNRWGVLIFQSDNINVPWNGYYKGELCQQGVYVWYVEGKYQNGKPFKMVGNVTLLQ
jgi:hypothetical protein